MKSSFSTIIKIGIFLFIGILFGVGISVYSHYRSSDGEETAHSIESFFGKREEKIRHIEKTFSVQPNGKFILSTNEGNVDIHTHDSNTVIVNIEAKGSDQRIDEFNVEFLQEGNNVKIKGGVHYMSFMRWETGDFDAHYNITLPKKFSVSISNKRDIKISSSDSDSENKNGITLTNLIGEVELGTNGSDIMVDSIIGNLEAKSLGGDIHLSSINGKIFAKTAGGDIFLKMKKYNNGVELKSSGGDINLDIDKKLNAVLDFATIGGDIECELPIETEDKSETGMKIRGKLNNGGERIKVKTAGGDIIVKELK